MMTRIILAAPRMSAAPFFPRIAANDTAALVRACSACNGDGNRFDGHGYRMCRACSGSGEEPNGRAA